MPVISKMVPIGRTFPDGTRTCEPMIRSQLLKVENSIIKYTKDTNLIKLVNLADEEISVTASHLGVRNVDHILKTNNNEMT